MDRNLNNPYKAEDPAALEDQETEAEILEDFDLDAELERILEMHSDEEHGQEMEPAVPGVPVPLPSYRFKKGFYGIFRLTPIQDARSRLLLLCMSR